MQCTRGLLLAVQAAERGWQVGEITFVFVDDTAQAAEGLHTLPHPSLWRLRFLGGYRPQLRQKRREAAGVGSVNGGQSGKRQWRAEWEVTAGGGRREVSAQ